MIESAIAMAGVMASVGIGAGVYYKLGKVEQKINFLYENCDVTISFKKRAANCAREKE